MKRIKMMNQKVINFFKVFILLAILIAPFYSFAQVDDLLSKEDRLWLESRNNTIIVYPEKSFAPFSYQSSSGFPQGLSIDYIELIAEKVGAKVEYLPARPLSQILEDLKNGRGDVATSLATTPEREKYLYFTDSYVDVSTVIVARKDAKVSKDLNLSDLVGKKVAVGKGYAVAEFLRENYPRIVLDFVSDDEVGLQQLVLGEVDFAIMDIASLSFYISKQVLSSVNVVGNVGFSYDLSFAVSKDKEILQSILNKGLTQITQDEREVLKEKWIIVPEKQQKSFWLTIRKTLSNDVFQYTFFLLVIFAMFFFFRSKKTYKRLFAHKAKVQNIKAEMEKLEEMNSMLSEELEQVREDEEELKEKLKSLDR